METPVEKQKFEVSQRLYDFRQGWGTVLAVNDLFIEIEFDSDTDNLWEYDEVEQIFLKPYEYTIEFVKK